ncbi:MAG: monovalent cation/H(+) antiporter subunit G [Bacteroidota bacterium]
MEILKIIGYILLLLGAVFLFLGALGLYRMPDVYTRLQAGTKASTLGAMAFMLGVGFLQPDWMVKIIIMIVFLTIANPLSSHAIARAAHKLKQKPYTKGEADALEEAELSIEKENQA